MSISVPEHAFCVNTILSVSVHMYMQVKFSPRRTKGVGLTDGEGTERLWSFLRDFSAITKEMSPEKRIDTLTDGLLHYGKGIVKKLGLFNLIFHSSSLFFNYNNIITDNYYHVFYYLLIFYHGSHKNQRVASTGKKIMLLWALF